MTHVFTNTVASVALEFPVCGIQTAYVFTFLSYIYYIYHTNVVVYTSFKTNTRLQLSHLGNCGFLSIPATPSIATTVIRTPRPIINVSLFNGAGSPHPTTNVTTLFRELCYILFFFLLVWKILRQRSLTMTYVYPAENRCWALHHWGF